MKTRPWNAPVISLLLLLVTAACGSGDGTAGYIGRVHPPKSPVLRVASGEDPAGLDPTRYHSQNAWRVARLLFEGLLAFTSEGHTTPGVASSWSADTEARVFTFHLRPEARWSDGSRVRAGDFIHSWRRTLDPSFASEAAETLYTIRGARLINEGAAGPETLGARAVSDTVLVVELEHPDPGFPARTALPPLFPVPPQETARDYLNWPGGRAPIGNGPFVLEAWRLNDRLVARRSDTYWNRDAIELERVIFYPITDKNTTVNLYRAGEIDWTTANTIPVDQARQFLGAGASEVHVSTVYATYYLELNTRREPLSDPRVRRALELTTSREEIAASIFGAGHRPSRVMITTDLPDWTAPEIAGGDAETARGLLADAGYPGGEGIPPLIYIYNTGGPHGAVAEFLQGTWQRQLGIRIEPTPMDYPSMEERGRRGDFHIMRSIWLVDLPAPIEFLEVLEGGNPNNLTGWRDSTYDALLEEARRTLNRQERYALLRRAEERLLTDVPIIPLLQYANVQLIKPYVEGLRPNPLDVVGWAGVRVDTGWHPPR